LLACFARLHGLAWASSIALPSADFRSIRATTISKLLRRADMIRRARTPNS
jgi:hypothetical protein